MNKKCWLLGSLFSFVMPLAFLLGKYAENREYLDLFHVLLVSGIVGVASLIIFILVALITRQPGCAGLCITLLGLFFFSKPLQVTLGSPFGLYVLIGLVLIALLVLGLWILSQRKNTMPVFVFSALFVMAFLLMSIVSTVRAEIGEKQRYQTIPRVEFSVDESLPSPNIYWLHADAMIGFEAMEYFFDDFQEEFMADLENYGFVIDTGAQFEAYHGTQTALPALFSPQFYDDYFVKVIEETYEGRMETLTSGSRYPIDMAPFDAIRKSNELVEAFEQKGYTTATIGERDIYFYPTTNYYYDCSDTADPDKLFFRTEENAEDLMTAITMSESHMRLYDLMEMTSLFPANLLAQMSREAKREVEQQLHVIPMSVEANAQWHAPLTSSDAMLSITRGLFECMKLPEPKLILVQSGVAHTGYNRDENGNLLEGGGGASLEYYAGQHRLSAKFLLNLIGFIMENDPNAVIVVQADHGPHEAYAVVDYVINIRAQGKDMLPYMWNSTMNAVHVPEAYGGLEDSVHPLNISRYLVNSFVGEGNYEYLSPDEIWVE